MENLAAFRLGRPHMAADVRQLRRGRVGNGVLVGDATLDLLLQEAVAVKGEEEVVNGGLLPRLAVPILPGPPGGGEQVRNAQQLPGVQAAAPVRPVQRLPHGPYAGERGGPPEADHPPGGVGLVQKAQDLLHLRLRRDPKGSLLGLGADGRV